MAFTGTPVVKLVADGLVRITGISLGDLANGTIGLFEKTVAPGIRLPEAFKPRTYDRFGPDVSLQDSIQVELVYVNTGIVQFPVKVVKTGTTPLDFVITLTNDAPVESGDTGGLEIYVRFH